MMLPKRLIVGLISLCLMIRCTGGTERCGASIRGACPPAWSQWGNKCYQKHSENLPWAEANQECIKMGSVLVMPQSQEETEFLLKNLAPFFRINCNDLQVEGTWVCQDGTTDVEYRNWRVEPAEPNNGAGGEDCAVADETGWNDVSCEFHAPTICKRPAPQLHF
ncbi:lactose-binding lectin l-2-like isoform X1 [Patiria miniata]|uniref:C-type lectin domain-containing protein n=1 Tax=Patiria miniata TaxID=46514 RepID=A0A914A2S7_PATMI|nr:lactose-binding lectin l-2-like [Patiria miniata]XP_038055059.1 lactose-binding lectin l-2-like [Patiria miniata]XP_038057681.1 lactose-binding lectin l-2-like isoform X1 [Patiria miniata]